MTTANQGPSSQTLFVDGCKITIAYSEQNNPTARHAILDALICNISAKNG